MSREVKVFLELNQAGILIRFQLNLPLNPRQADQPNIMDREKLLVGHEGVGAQVSFHKLLDLGCQLLGK